MNPETAAKLKLEVKPVSLGDPLRLTGADGNALNIVGTVSFELKIAGYLFPTKAIVVHKLTESLLIGSHFCKAYSVVINFADAIFSIDQLLSIRVHSKQQSRAVVRSIHRIYIPPYSIATIVAKTDQAFCNRTCLVSEIPTTQFNTFAVERIVVTNRNRKIPVRILNHTPHEIIIKAKQAVATVAEITSKNATLVDMGTITDHAMPRPGSMPPYTACNVGTSTNDILQNSPTPQHTGCTQNKRPSNNKLDEFLQTHKFKIHSELTTEQRYDLAAVLYKYRDVFIDDISGMSGIRVTPAEIEIKDEFKDKRVYTRNYPMAPEQKAECHRQIMEWRDAGLIVPASARAGFNYNSPLLLVKRKVGCPRLCIDLRKINKIVQPVVVSLPHIADIVERVAEQKSRYYTTLDFRQSFLQVRLAEGQSRDVLSFTDPCDGMPYSMASAPFGFVSSGSYLASALSTVLRGLESDGSLALYVDDVLVGNVEFSDHISSLDRLLARFQKYNVKVGIGKSAFAARKCQFLGVEFSEAGHRAIPTFSDRLAKEYKPPINRKGVIKFLAWSGYYRRYIKSYSKRTFNLRRLKRPDTPFVFDDACMKEFEDIKAALVSPEILTGFDRTRAIVVKTDASLLGIGICLCQYDTDGREFTIAYHSQATSEAQSKWSSWELELFAVLVAYRKFRTILACTKSYVLTDNNAVLNFKTLEINSPKVARWLIYLSGFCIETRKVSGKDHSVPDSLSRLSEGLTKEERAELLVKKDEDIEDFILHVKASVDANASLRCKADRMEEEVSKELIADTNRRHKQAAQRFKICKQVTAAPVVDTVGSPAHNALGLIATTDSCQQTPVDFDTHATDILNANVAKQDAAISDSTTGISYGFKSKLNPLATEFIHGEEKLQSKSTWIQNMKKQLTAVNAITRQQTLNSAANKTLQAAATSSGIVPELEDEAVDLSIPGTDEPEDDNTVTIANDANRDINEQDAVQSSLTPQTAPQIVDEAGQPIELKEDEEDVVELPQLAITAQSYEQDDEFGDMYCYLTTAQLPTCNKQARKTLLTSDLFYIENDLLYYIEHTRSKKLRRLKKIRPRLCIPRSHQSYVLDHFHTFLNHASVERLYKTASETVYFHKLFEACHMLVQTCQTCILGRAKHTVLNPLNQHQIQTEFGRSWSIDYLNLNRVTPGGYKFICVCVESSSGYIECRLAKTLTSSEFARILVDSIWLHHGPASVLVTDRGSNLCNRLIAKVTAILGCKHKMTSSGNSRAGGRAEIAVKAVRHALQLTCKNDLLIEEHLPLVQLGLNAAWSSTTGTSPWFCRNLKDFPILQGVTGTPADLGQTDSKIGESDRQYLATLYRATEQIRKNIALNLAESRAKQAKCFNKRFKTQMSTFKVGDEVVIHSKGPKAGSDCVFTHNKNVGWFRVVKVYDNSKEGEGPAYRLVSLITGRMLRNPIAAHRLHAVDRDRTEFHKKFPPLPGLQDQDNVNSHVTISPERNLSTMSGIPTPKTKDNEYIGHGFYKAKTVLKRKRTAKGPMWLVEWMDGTTNWLATRDVSYPLRAAWLKRQRKETVVTSAKGIRRY